MSIAQQYLYTLLSTQLLLVRALNTELSDVVARLVVVVLLDISWRDLSHIAKHVGTHIIGILAHTTLLYVETGETVHLLLEHAEVLIAKLTHEELLGES